MTLIKNQFNLVIFVGVFGWQGAEVFDSEPLTALKARRVVFTFRFRNGQYLLLSLTPMHFLGRGRGLAEGFRRLPFNP